MRVRVGRIQRAHGIRGEVSIELFTDEVDRRFAKDAEVFVGNDALVIEHARMHQGRLLVRFVGVPDRTAAETFRGREVFADVDENERPEDPDEFFDRDLIGLTVRNHSHDSLGTVIRVEHLPAQDLLVIETDHGPARVPFVSALVSEVNLDEGFLLVANVPGLLNLAEAEDAG